MRQNFYGIGEVGKMGPRAVGQRVNVYACGCLRAWFVHLCLSARPQVEHRLRESGKTYLKTARQIGFKHFCNCTLWSDMLPC